MNRTSTPLQIDAISEINNQSWSSLKLGETQVQDFVKFKAPLGQNSHLDRSKVVWYQYKFPRKSKVSHIYFQFAPTTAASDYLAYTLDKIRLSLTFTNIEDVFAWFGNDFELFKGNSSTSFLDRYRLIYKEKGILIKLKGNRPSAAIPSKALVLENSEIDREAKNNRYESIGRGQEAWRKLLYPGSDTKPIKKNKFVTYGRVVSLNLTRSTLRIRTKRIKNSYIGGLLYVRKANKTVAKIEIKQITHTGITGRLIRGDIKQIKRNQNVFKKTKTKS